MLPAGIDIAGTAAMPMPASTIPSIVVTWRVSQILAAPASDAPAPVKQHPVAGDPIRPI